MYCIVMQGRKEKKIDTKFSFFILRRYLRTNYSLLLDVYVQEVHLDMELVFPCTLTSAAVFGMLKLFSY